ncbi:alpha-amylase family protein [Terriglobus tenax]|uniref:alpha-amylase family protein n=1 Tax=Terriglobus tenax TaxID=1111115 RepID=UPI0021DFE547|nr:alpha-amylase family protein [Terriglobus tenax]
MINDLWYKNAIVYCLSVETFQDGNGDGIGDFQGLIRRLDYLQGLGVTAIWLMPFQTSPQKDDGYDIADYYSVDSRYGTLGDFVDFTHACEQRGMRVLIDLVVNHTSNQHPWFKDARSSPDSPYRDWYVWSKKKPKNANTGMVFPGVQQTTWTWDEAAKEFYFHRFYEFQPDLNTANPAVQAEILKIMGFWIQLGVSGFRMDAVPFVIAKKGSGVTRPVEDYDMLRTFAAFLSWRKGDAIILAEANVLPTTDMQYFGESGERLSMMFNFNVNQHLFYSLATADTRPLETSLTQTKPRPATAQWGTFLRNHDELDLGRLTEPQRRKVFAAFGPDKSMQLYGRGIRRRLAPMLRGDRRRIELAYSLLFSLPGTPVLWYGDEIGMGEDLSLPERYSCRTAMQWTNDNHAGFTPATRSRVNVIRDSAFGYQHVNVAEQRRDPNSLMDWMERMIRVRKETPEIGWGDFSIIDTGHREILGLRYDWRGNHTLVLHNFADAPIELCLSPRAIGDGAQEGKPLVNILSKDHSFLEEDNGHYCIHMEPYGYRWFRVGGFDGLLLKMAKPEPKST